MSSSFSRSRESARALGLRARIECIRALRTISSVEKELNLLFSPLFLLEGVSSRCVCTRGKKIARARARDPNESSDAGENESRRFFSRARIVLRVRAREITNLERRTLRGEPAKRESFASSRKNPKKCESRFERTFLLSSFDRSKLVSRGFLQNGIAREFSVSSENETSRKYSYDARVVSLPPTKFVQMLFLFFFVLVGFFSPKGSFCALFL